MEIKTAAAIGMGAVGTVYAKRLYDQYGSHFFAIADHERAERLRSSGVTLDGEAFFPQICEPEQADGAVDLILICVKNDQLEPAIASIRPFVERHTILLPLLNGVTATQRLRAAFPENTVLCGLRWRSTPSVQKAALYIPLMGKSNSVWRIRCAISRR